MGQTAKIKNANQINKISSISLKIFISTNVSRKEHYFLIFQKCGSHENSQFKAEIHFSFSLISCQKKYQNKNRDFFRIFQ